MAINFVEISSRVRRRSISFRYDVVGHIVACSDFAVITFSSLLCGMIYDLMRDGASTVQPDSTALGVLFAVLFVLIMQQGGFYRPIELLRPVRQASKAFAVWLIISGFLTIITFAMKAGHLLSRATTISSVLLAFAVVLTSRFAWYRVIGQGLRQGTFATRRVAVIADGSRRDLGHIAKRLMPFGLSVCVPVQLPAAGADAATVDATVQQAIAAIRGSDIEEVIVAIDFRHPELAERVLGLLRILPLPVKLMLDDRLSDLVLRPHQQLGNDLVAVEMHRAPMTFGERAAKRALDVTLAGTLLLLLSPMLVLVGLLIRLDSPGPILFRQTRNGFNNKPFKILKFRSMRVMEDGEQVQQAKRADARVTAVGRWIRRLSIDELPQLWNVLRGEMSIVGPRPHAMAHDEHFEKLIGDYPYRQQVKPGLTGWAQINGSRGETPTTESMAERVKLDIWYVENASIWLDIRIMLRTFITLLNVKHTY